MCFEAKKADNTEIKLAFRLLCLLRPSRVMTSHSIRLQKFGQKFNADTLYQAKATYTALSSHNNTLGGASN